MSSNPAISEAIAAVHEFATGEVPCDAALGDELEQMRRLADVAEAAYATMLRVFDARGVSEATEVLSTRQWAKHHLNVAAGETTRQLKIAKVVAKLPVVEAALVAGEIRMPHTSAIAEAVALIGIEAIEQCQDELVNAARLNDPMVVRAALRGYGAAVDSKNAKRRARRDQEGRWLDVATTFKGAVAIEGVLDAETGAIVQAAINAAAKPWGANDTRTPAQRRADALVDICRGLSRAPEPVEQAGARATAGNPPQPGTASTHAHESESAGACDDAVDEGTPRPRPDDSAARSGTASPAGAHAANGCPCRGRGARPSLTIVCDLETLLRHTGGFGELSNGQIVPGDTVRRLACDASISRVVTGPNSLPLDVGRAQRTVTAAQLKALRVRDGRCRFPGCDRPFEWTDAHHVQFWAHGGNSDIANLILLCRRHHTAVHEGGWLIEAMPNGEFRFLDPDGFVVCDPAARSTRAIVDQLVTSGATP